MTLMGIDVGSSGCRVVAFAEDLTELASATADYPVPTDRVGAAVIDADVIADAVFACIRLVNQRTADNPVTALAIACMGEAVVPVDRLGRPLAAMPLSADRTGADELARISDELGENWIRSTTGQPVHPMFSIAPIAWWRRHADFWPEVHQIVDVAGYLQLRLGLRPRIDYTMAARTQLLDTASRSWDPALLQAAGCPAEILPEPVPVSTVIGTVAGDVAAALGFTGEIAVLAGAHDQACAYWGSGMDSAGRSVLSLGTTECLTTAHDGRPTELIDRNYSSYPVDDGDRWLSLAGIPAGGAALLWVAGTVHQDLTDLLDRLPEQPASVLCLPHFLGSGTVENDPRSTGAFVGLTLATSGEELLLAVLEGSGFEVAKTLTVLERFADPAAAVRVVGGGSRHPRAISARADAAGIGLLTVTGHATARGAAALAGVGTGLWPGRADAVSRIAVGNPVTPNPELADWYATRRSQHHRLHAALASVTADLNTNSAAPAA